MLNKRMRRHSFMFEVNFDLGRMYQNTCLNQIFRSFVEMMGRRCLIDGTCFQHGEGEWIKFMTIKKIAQLKIPFFSKSVKVMRCVVAAATESTSRLS